MANKISIMKNIVFKASKTWNKIKNFEGILGVH